MHVEGQHSELLATVGGDGACIVWQLTAQEGQPVAQQLTQLEPPKSRSWIEMGMLVGLLGQPPELAFIAVGVAQQPTQLEPPKSRSRNGIWECMLDAWNSHLSWPF
jgi:hypothetical protein